MKALTTDSRGHVRCLSADALRRFGGPLTVGRGPIRATFSFLTPAGAAFHTGMLALLLFLSVLAFTSVSAQILPIGPDQPTPAPEPGTKPEAPQKVEVTAVVDDDEIRQRIEEILQATGWFSELRVTVNGGIVILAGTADTDESKEWAGGLARNTEGVVVFINQMDVAAADIWDFEPAFEVLNDLARGFIRWIPLILVALVLLLIFWMLAKLTVLGLRRGRLIRSQSHLLREVAARAGGLLVMLAGVYLVLRIAGLTQAAFTVVGGTGLLGLVLGIAFRDITENFLASIFLSLQQPFREGDLIEVENITGFVQQLTSRTTVLMTLDGNQAQIPNSTIFKSTIRNFSSNPNRRDDFIVGIGYDDSIPVAQEIAMKVLVDHPAVLEDPEPLVLVEDLGASTVNLRVYFWLDGGRHSWLKVRSSVIRLVKRAYQDAGISMPDEAREVTFPNGVPVRMMETERAAEPAKAVPAKPAAQAAQPEEVSTKAEAGLESEAAEIKEQARQSWTPGENLLTPPPE
ncbi:hypothetical protein BH24ACI3_BH24ACI3_05510 [soil metagenome]